MTQHESTFGNRGALRRASLEVLRAEAHDELRTVIFERLHRGEDPWAFMELLPTVDEFVVLSLRAELVAADHGRQPTATSSTGCCGRSRSPTPSSPRPSGR